MSKSSDLATRLARNENIPLTKAKARIEQVFLALQDELAETGSTKVQNFGVFNTSPLKRSSTLHGKKYVVDTNVIRFSAFKRLKSSVNS